MIIPPYIKRRVVDIDYHLNMAILVINPHYTIYKEEYLDRVSRNLCHWFVHTYDYNYETAVPTDYYKKVNELIPVFKYLIRTKVIVHWEKMNGVKE
jgi:hypothetical protein